MSPTKYDTIGIGYNNTRKADPYLTNRLFDLLQPKKDKLYLDIGCGTGNYTIALAERGVNFVGIEPSEKMITQAKARSKNVQWLQGVAEEIPFDKNVFNGVMATLTIHHWTNLEKAFKEIGRVLTDTGRFVIFTSLPEQTQSYWLSYYFPQMIQRASAQLPSFEKVKEATEDAGMKITITEKYFVKDDLQDQFLYSGKNNPELYFDENIRRGISSFSSLADKEEVEEGLNKLKTDIENETFESIKEKYINDMGDYLFMKIEKDGIK
ncbi:MAG: class I SAM-dependent methyltransferase [Bacteroidia bacterium]